MSRRPLTPVETASAGIMGGLSVAVLVVGGALLGGSGGLVAAVAALPVAILSYRRRTRAVVACAVAVFVVASVAGGVPSALSGSLAVLTGAVLGSIRRRGRGWGAVIAAGFAIGLLGAGLQIGSLLVFAESRELYLTSIKASADGSVGMVQKMTEPLLAGLPPQQRTEQQAMVVVSLELFRRMIALVVRYWWAALAISTVVFRVPTVAIAHGLVGAVLRRLDLDDSDDLLDEALRDERPVGPLPVRLGGVGYRYPGADHDALGAGGGIDLTIGAGETIALVGPNGSGKSTLATILAGATPTRGTVERPGSAGLGRAGGTALLAQRSELQLLGETVEDDVRWGLGADEEVDVPALLELVGLSGREQDSPATLSGGELQRLSLAGALARRPALLVTDESTAMVDPAGRAELMAVLRELPHRLGTTVVHVTHDPAEAGGMDRMIRIEAGRVVSDTRAADRPPLAPPPPAGPTALPEPGEVVLTLSGVGHTYLPGTPWEWTALSGVDLELHAREGVLVTGANGSGKSTLARIMAGLLAPTQGWCEAIPHRPMRMSIGRVALAQQFSRLQLRRPTVGADLLDAVDAHPHDPLLPEERTRAEYMLATVGLPASLVDRSVDRLSGGQMRRVALAGLLATRPAVLVLDEPFAGLDAESRDALTSTLERELWRGLALVVITHDVHGLENLCRRRLVLQRGRLVDPAEAESLSGAVAQGCPR